MDAYERLNHSILHIAYRLVCVATMLVPLIISSANASGLYRCLDPSGVLIFTDSPAQLSTCTALNIETVPPSSKISPLSGTGPHPEERPRTEPPEESHNAAEVPQETDAPNMPGTNASLPSTTSVPSPEAPSPP